jgi:predicted transcriptional regulator of viral defense system
VKRSSKESQANLFAIAGGQGGYFTGKQAEEAGFDRTHHSYHVQAGNWQREHRGIFRLAQYPMPERPDLILWSLWSRNRDGVPEGVYSHQTALSLYDMTDLMPSKLHMTVPIKFRRMAETPAILELHFADLAANEIEEREGYWVTSPIRTIVDTSSEVPHEMLAEAFSEARSRGLITEKDVTQYRDKLPAFLFPNSKKLQAT